MFEERQRLLEPDKIIAQAMPERDEVVQVRFETLPVSRDRIDPGPAQDLRRDRLAQRLVDQVLDERRPLGVPDAHDRVDEPPGVRPRPA